MGFLDTILKLVAEESKDRMVYTLPQKIHKLDEGLGDFADHLERHTNTN
jgi:hypothetical protein